MAKWRFDQTTGLGGVFQIIARKHRGAPIDITVIRGALTVLSSYSSADPFGDAVAALEFPTITAMDDFNASDIGAWLADYTDIDIWYLPGVVDPMGRYVSPLTGQQGVSASPSNPAREKVWEGFIASFDLTSDDQSSRLQVQCQGALFQADRYLQKPFYPPRPVPLDELIRQVFDHSQRPHLRTQPLRVDYPAGWAKIGPSYTAMTTYTPMVAPGAKWCGYATRSTGSWDRALTGFTQDLIAVMLTQDDSGVMAGNQWTVLGERESATGNSPGRQPVLTIRDRFRVPDFAIWLGTPGVTTRLTRDTTQAANLIYGDGTGIDGTVWRNAVINADGSRTDYKPLAAHPSVYPPIGNDFFDAGSFATEAYLKYGTGFNEDDAIKSAAKTLQRDLDAGWAGTMTLAVDPSTTLSRWQIAAGMTVSLQGFQGTGEAGMSFHIAEVDANPTSGQVTLKVDTRYRDLLNLEESMSRTRDPLTPAKLLQVNRASVTIEDIMAPWDYTAGSGFIPQTSIPLYTYKPAIESFPYNDWVGKHPPFMYPQWYVTCQADAPDRASRWAGPIPVLMSEKGTIRRTEVFAVDKWGQLVLNPFHMSLYYVNVHAADMPYGPDGLGPSPFIQGAFESINPATGQPWDPGSFLRPDQSMIIGWGNYQQRAGFSPGRETDGGQPTGLLVDESSWTFDCTNNPNFNKQAQPGTRQITSAITIYAMFYAEYTEPMYFGARLYRQEPGT